MIDISKILQNKKFAAILTLAGLTFLAFGIYDRYINIRRNKMEIIKMQEDEK